MRKSIVLLVVMLLGLTAAQAQYRQPKPWDNGRLKVSDNGRYLVFENGKPFFWQGETAWLLTSRLQREEIDFFLRDRARKGFNVVQVSIFHYWPQFNVYGQCTLPYGTWDFKKIDQPGVYGYWDHVDYAVEAAARNGMYLAIVCTWGSEIVRAGHMTVEDAKKYGKFLGERYKDKPNIIWIIGGDIAPDRMPGHMEIWNALATSIKSVDKNHLMTYHPDGRRSSAEFFNDAEWLDFNAFQSGHRRYGQNFGQTQGYPIEQGTEEDNWRYVEKAYAMTPVKPVIDAEPSYEGLPQGLRSADEPYWTPAEIRRYGSWSVFAGSFGHTYGDNAVMQFYIPSIIPSFFPLLPWYEAINEPASGQMQYLKKLMCTFPFTEGRPDQSVIVGDPGQKHDRLIATRGDDYLLVYDYTNKEMEVDLDKISGAEKKVFWYLPENGKLTYIGQYAGKQHFLPDGGYGAGKDKVLVAFDASKDYIPTDAVSIDWQLERRRF